MVIRQLVILKNVIVRKVWPSDKINHRCKNNIYHFFVLTCYSYVTFCNITGLPIPIVAVSAAVSHEHYDINDRYGNNCILP